MVVEWLESIFQGLSVALDIHQSNVETGKFDLLMKCDVAIL